MADTQLMKLHSSFSLNIFVFPTSPLSCHSRNWRFGTNNCLLWIDPPISLKPVSLRICKHATGPREQFESSGKRLPMATTCHHYHHHDPLQFLLPDRPGDPKSWHAALGTTHGHHMALPGHLQTQASRCFGRGPHQSQRQALGIGEAQTQGLGR